MMGWFSGGKDQARAQHDARTQDRRAARAKEANKARDEAAKQQRQQRLDKGRTIDRHGRDDRK